MQGAAWHLPVMVDTKMDRSVHACTLMSPGMGTRNLIAAPIATDNSSGTGFAPCKISFAVAAVQANMFGEAMQEQHSRATLDSLAVILQQAFRL